MHPQEQRRKFGVPPPFFFKYTFDGDVDYMGMWITWGCGLHGDVDYMFPGSDDDLGMEDMDDIDELERQTESEGDADTCRN